MKGIIPIPVLIVILGLLPGVSLVPGAEPAPKWSASEQDLADYFREETARLDRRCLAGIQSIEDWKQHRSAYREELFEMLGLSPRPDRTDLKPVVTGRLERADFSVENLAFQSRPGLYVTANLYLPKPTGRAVPAVLYLSGHGPVVKNGVSYGNKVHYQHHGIWFARNGFACLILDTVQMGEIQGIHHGTYREGMWWWNSRGYTPAGVEAWNAIRALDYLESRPEVDATRIGATGRSGGGAYTWWIAALDDRIKVAAPVAGMTDLQNHVVDGTVEGHCDCMFIVNTFSWDYPQVAALVAPRPLLIVNTDSDSIFPLDGVQRVYAKVRRIYALHRATDKLGLVIGPGPHRDTQDLQVPVFRWFNRHLKGNDPLIEMAAVPMFEPEQLQVFKALPSPERTSRIYESFVPLAPTPKVFTQAQEWVRKRDAWMEVLREKCFSGWPEISGSLNLRRVSSVERYGLRLEIWDFESQPHVTLRLYTMESEAVGEKKKRILLTVFPDEVLQSGLATSQNPRADATAPRTSPDWSRDLERVELVGLDFSRWLAAMRAGFEDDLREEIQAARTPKDPDSVTFHRLQRLMKTNAITYAFVAPRGVGLTAWNPDVKRQIHIRRRFMLLGQTLAGMRVWDIRRAIQALGALGRAGGNLIELQGRGTMACNVLYASLFEPGLESLNLWDLPRSHRAGPDYLNVLRFLDVPQAVAMAMENHRINLHVASTKEWGYPVSLARAMEWDPVQIQTDLPAPATGE
jgi:dienelactone hydrolase